MILDSWFVSPFVVRLAGTQSEAFVPECRGVYARPAGERNSAQR